MSSPFTRGSLVEDRAARKLLEAGDGRYDVEEYDKAVEVWESVIERYPRSRVRFDAHARLGDHLLERERAYDRARFHFQAVASEDNSDEEQRAEGLLKVGVCYYEAGNFGKTFQVMRDLIEQFPLSGQVNQAYYYIGLGHFQLGHYSRAIESLEKVGTALTEDDTRTEKLEANKRLFVKIEDADLAALGPDQAVRVVVTTTQGDREEVECLPVGRNVRVVIGSLMTNLGRPAPGNGVLEVRGDDQVTVDYTDEHTADRKLNVPRQKAIPVVGDAVVEITDGAFQETLQGVVLGREMHVQVTDADRDLSDEADRVTAVVEVYREKTPSEIQEELAALATENASNNERPATADSAVADLLEEEPQIEKFKLIDQVEISLDEAKVARRIIRLSIPSDEPEMTASENPLPEVNEPITPEGEQADPGIHTGVFRALVPLVKAEEPIAGDDLLQALPGDKIKLVYQDERNMTDEVQTVGTEARAIEGNLGGVRVTQADISDQELRIKTQLKTASALTNIGNRYKEFGLKQNAQTKYQEALGVCEEITPVAQRLGGRLLEETYVQLWQIYFAMERLNLAAAMCERLQREFPASGFVDDALLQLAEVNRTQGELQQAISIYSRLVAMKTSSLRGEAQFGIGECYEQMARAAEGPQAAQLYDRAFREYQQVYDRFPDSGRVGEAVAKMANYYYQQQDYVRAIDIFESVLREHPDAKFLDVILFNYGRCLYRLERKGPARQQFDQLIADFPESPLAANAKQISEELIRQGF